MKTLKVALILLTLVMTGCAKSPDYYTNPNKGGYLKQITHGICKSCSTHFKTSAYQTDHYDQVICPKCGTKQDIEQAKRKYAAYKIERDRLQAIQNQQAFVNIVGAVFLGVVTGYAKAYMQPRSISPYSPTLSDQCWSNMGCGVGRKCVKAPYESTGICMETVNEYGIRTYDYQFDSDMEVNISGTCDFDIECPVGFKCDQKYKTCLKR